MSCPKHNDEPLSERAFQRAPDAWLTSWCKRCGRMQFFRKSNPRGELENQPMPA